MSRQIRYVYYTEDNWENTVNLAQRSIAVKNVQCSGPRILALQVWEVFNLI